MHRWAKCFTERGREVHIISFEQLNIELNGINIYIIKTKKVFRVDVQKIELIYFGIDILKLNLRQRIVPEDDFDEKQLNKIRGTVRGRSEGWNVEFKFIDAIERTGVGMGNFTINDIRKMK